MLGDCVFGWHLESMHRAARCHLPKIARRAVLARFVIEGSLCPDASRSACNQIASLSETIAPKISLIVSVRPDCPAALIEGEIVSASDSGHYGVLCGSADEAALD